MDDVMVINGVEYVRKTPTATGTRAIVVVDRGWIFAGEAKMDASR